MCSSTRGPAIAPSLVTWPTKITAMPRCLARRVSCAAHSRTWETLPGAEVSASVYIVWIESTTSTSGDALPAAATIASSWTSARSSTGALTSPSRWARIATCSTDSSPVT